MKSVGYFDRSNAAYRWQVDFSSLVGAALVEVNGLAAGSGDVEFITDSGERFVMFHYQECCEGVSIVDVCGDVAALIGSPILLAEEVTNRNEWPTDTPAPSYEPDSFTWTFYKLATIKGSVTIRWLGESNGYYGEEVTFAKVPANEAAA